MINLRKTLNEAHLALQNAQVEHALIGGFALATYGLHRATADIDFLANGLKKELIKKCLTSAGFKIRNETNEVLQFTGVGFLDIILANRPLSLEMLTQAQENMDLGIYVLKPEDLIGLKIQAYKNDSARMLQDKSDIQNLLKMPNLDMNKIKKYADLFQEWSDIERLIK